MKECKRFYYDAREDCTWTIFYADNSRSIVEELPIAYDCIGNTSAVFSLLENVSQDYPIECSHWNFENDGCLCPILINKKWGFINSKFQIVIQPIFDFVGTEIEDSNGPCYRPPMYYHETKWVNGECKVVMNGKEQYIKEKDYCIGDSNYVIETKTNYAYRLKYMDDPTFDKVRDLAVKFYRELPQELQDDLYDALNRGVDILDSEPQMTAYMFSFGKMHQTKLEYAFSKLPEEFLEEPEINIIDYGCGQALGTMCYADFLREKGCSQKVKTITLIEPSETCLKRAALHSSVFFPDAAIKTVNKKFDDLTIDDIVCDEETPTLHILSNVLDMLNFDLDKFTRLIESCLKGFNQFVCVGPYIKHIQRDSRMKQFANSISDDVYCEIMGKRGLNSNKDWTCVVSLFSVGLASCFSTKVTDEDWEDVVKDEFYALYSKNGNRFIKANKWEEYCKIKEGTRIICDNAFNHNYYDNDRLSNLLDWRNKLDTKHESGIINDLYFEIENEGIDDLIREEFQPCAIKDVVIPASIISIGDAAFEGCEFLQQIEFMGTIRYIGKNVFQGCQSLERIIIPEGSTGAFMKLLDEELWDKLIENLSAMVPDNSLTETIEERGAVYSKDMKRLLYVSGTNWCDIKGGANVICDRAFEDIDYVNPCLYHIIHLTIPDSVIKIGNYAFLNCGSLAEITLPKSLLHIGDNPFLGCGPILIKSESSRFIIDYDMLIDRMEGRVVSYCGKGGRVCIPRYMDTYAIKTIGKEAFSPGITQYLMSILYTWCQSIEQIIIASTVTVIEERAFKGCESLQEIKIPNSVTSIGKNAFIDCSSLQRIIVPLGSIEKFKIMLDARLWDKLVEE